MFGQGNSSAIVLQDLNTPTLAFTVEVDSTGNIMWTKGGAPYTVLGSKNCNLAEYLEGGSTADSYDCVSNPTQTSDAIGRALTTCNATNDVPVYRTSAGGFVCEPDYDTLRVLGCTEGQTVRTNGTTASCVNDADWVAAAAAGCPTGGVPRFNGTGWFCGGDNDTLRNLACSNGQIAKYLDNAWVCAADNNTLSLSCTTGQTIVMEAGVWVCGNDKDTFKSLTGSCTGSFDTPVVVSAGVWGCVASPTISLSLTTGIAIFSYGYRFNGASGKYPTDGSIGGYSDIPWVSPYSGSIRAWSIHSGALGASPIQATAQLFLNGAAISSLSNLSGPSTQTPVTTKTAVGANFNAGDTFGFIIYQNASAAGFVTVNIYAALILT